MVVWEEMGVSSDMGVWDDMGDRGEMDVWDKVGFWVEIEAHEWGNICSECVK